MPRICQSANRSDGRTPFAADFARVATLQFTNSVGDARMHWLGIHRRTSRPVRTSLTHPKSAGQVDAGSTAGTAINWPIWRTTLAETPEPGGKAALLDNTLIVWTNELGKGNSHTLDNIPLVMVGTDSTSRWADR